MGCVDAILVNVLETLVDISHFFTKSLLIAKVSLLLTDVSQFNMLPY